MDSGGDLKPCEGGNAPLKWGLKGLDPNHHYLAERGIRRDTAEAFGVGYFAGNGELSGRVVIPIYNQRGELVAYAGRTIDDSEPKYKFPAGFDKSLELHNLHRVKTPERGGLVYLVEGFFDCMKLHQAGFPAVALMGSKISDTQIELLSRKFTHTVLLLDEDEAGMDGTIDALLSVSHFMYVSTGCIPSNRNGLDEMTDDEIRKALTTDIVELKHAGFKRVK